MRLVFTLVVAPAPAAAAQLTVVAIDPPLNSGNRAANAETKVDFDRAVSAASLGSFGVHGSMGGGTSVTKMLENGGLRIRFRPARPWHAGEVVMIGMADSLQATDNSFLRDARSAPSSSSRGIANSAGPRARVPRRAAAHARTRSACSRPAGSRRGTRGSSCFRSPRVRDAARGIAYRP